MELFSHGWPGHLELLSWYIFANWNQSEKAYRFQCKHTKWKCCTLSILIRNSQCFSSLELNRNNIYFKKKTDDLRNDRWYTLGDEFSLNQHKVWLSPMSELRSRVSMVQSSFASLVLLLFQHHHPLIYDTFVYILAHCANCQSMGRGNPYLALEIVENRPKS